MASRYSGSRYDGDSRRSRSRDRSPDRRSLYSDGGPRRSSAESRSNAAAFQTNRDSFRDTLPRDTPRGPKALLDPPSGPRGGGYSGEFRGRGRGRGRGWRDDSRDRGRDRDIEFRDRRDTYRDERSRERERSDWRDRDRDSFRGRRPSPRGRSPPGRDFRDPRELRDGPLGVDADRARRGSRDGPLSAGSSSSDPPFAHSSYRGGYGRGRGRGRGGDWDRGRGRPFYDDRDRYAAPFRSRSQEGRFRDRDDRERDNRYLDADLRLRDPRDDRETRSKLDRTSHEPPTSSKDVSPPPVAPAAPSFGSVPNRTALTSDIGSATGKAPPTGPRALKDDRPAPISAPSIVDTRAPPTGPSKPSFMERSPPIPSGPRSQRPGPSSKQWINPNLKHRVPESPKLGRSLSFAQSRPAGFRPDGAQSDQLGDSQQRPRSSDAKADSQAIQTDSQLEGLQIIDPGEVSKFEPRPQSAGSSVDRDYKRKDEFSSMKNDTEAIDDAEDILTTGKTTAGLPKSPKVMLRRRPTLKVPAIRISLPKKQRKQPILDQSSESDDEEFGDIIEAEMIGVEKKLKQLEVVEDAVPMDAIVRYALVSLEAVSQIATEPEGLEDMVGPIPETAAFSGKPTAKPDPQAEEQPLISDIPSLNEDECLPKEVDAAALSASKELAAPSGVMIEHPQPSIEQDIDILPTHKVLPITPRPKSDDADVSMEDAMPSQVDSEVQPSGLPVPIFQREPVLPSFDEAQIDSRNASKRESSTPSPPEDDEETDIEDVDLQTIEIVREHLQTPPLESLPYFDEKAWDKDKAFIRSMNAPQPDLNNFILQRLKDDAWSLMAVNDQLRKAYGGNYDRYIRFTMSDDPVAVKSREKFTYVPGASDPGGHKPGLTADPKPESTRRSRYASERDLERVLEESRRVEDEKRERQLQAEREKYRTDKEAVIPRQYQTENERENDFYTSTTGLVRAEKIVATWEVLPPVDNFTEEEYGVFEKAYLEFPKQWGRVSEPLANRDFGTSIQFYYLKKEKEELNLKEKLKKQPKKRKRGGRNKARSSALVSELGNGDNDNEETQETGENGERRRPRRAAAPTFNSEATPATDGESGTPAGTPGRRGAAAARADGTVEKPKRGRRAAKDKEPKPPRVALTLAAALPTPVPPPSTGNKGNRSRSTSRVQGPDWTGQPAQDEVPRLPQQYELAPNPSQPVPGPPMQPYLPTQPLVTSERAGPVPSISEPMAPPPLRPEPPPQPAVAILDMGQPTLPDRKSGAQPSSYWSVPEATEFPSLLRSFGSDWAAIAVHMRTKTAVMVKNFYTRKKDSNDWEALVKEAEDRKNRGEKRPPPPTLTTSVKKRYDTSTNRPLAAADATMEDVSVSKVEHPPTSQSMTGRFNIPIAAQPQPPVVQSSFVQTTQAPSLVQSHIASQAGPQALVQPATQTMSPGSRPLRAPLPFPDREREPFPQQPSRTPLVSKPPQTAPPTVSESSIRHPLPGSLMDPQIERQKAEPKPIKEPARQQERPQMRVKQEPDLISQHDFYGGPPAPVRVPPPRMENVTMSSRPAETSRAPTQAPQAPYAVLQHQPGRSFMVEPNPSSPVPQRPMSNLSRPMSGAGGAEPYNAPPAQRTPPAVAPAPPRPPKTSNLMALLNDDPPAPPKRVAEVPAVSKSSSTPPPPASLSRPPPPPPPASHVRRDSSIPESQPYGYGRNPPPPPPSSMPALKPYTASPQAQSLNAPRHMPLEGPTERDYYGGRPRPFPPATAGSPQNTPHYQPPTQPPQVQYQPQPSYPYGAPVQAQPPNASSPPPQYAPHQPTPRSHEPSSSRETGWPGANQGHPLQQQHQQHQQPQQQQPAWASHPQQPPKSTQPQPPQSAWAAQHASAPKPPQPSSSVPPQSSWASGPPPRGHEQMALRDIYPPPRMQPPLQGSYPPSSRATDPPPPQGPAGYPRYASTPGPGRDPRDPGPPRSYTPVSAYDSRVYPPQGQDMRDAHLREQQQQQQSVLQQQLRPQDRHLYERPPPDRYGR